MAFCGNCGAEMQEGMRFCASCGTRWGEVASVPMATTPAPMVDSFQNTFNIRNQNISEIRRMINYFGQKQALYDEYESLQEQLERLDPSTTSNSGCLTWYSGYMKNIFPVLLIVLLIFGALGLFAQKDSALIGVVFLIIGVLLLVRFFKKRSEKKETINQSYRRINDIASELSKHYKAYGQCMVGYEYSNPRILSQIGAIIEKGRADTIKEAINRMLEDNHRSYVELQSAMAARSARQAELAADMTAIAVLCSPKSFYK